MTPIDVFEFFWRHRDLLEPLIRELRLMIEVGKTDAQIRKRIADGIESGELISGAGLHAMRIASQSVNDYLGRG